jgi:hypothetical protein
VANTWHSNNESMPEQIEVDVALQLAEHVLGIGHQRIT